MCIKYQFSILYSSAKYHVVYAAVLPKLTINCNYYHLIFLSVFYVSVYKEVNDETVRKWYTSLSHDTFNC